MAGHTDAPRDKQVNIRLTENQRKRWKRKADESTEYHNLTHLIERAVEHEIESDDEDTSDQTSTDTTEQVVGLDGETKDRLDSMEGLLQQVNDQVRGIANSTSETGYSLQKALLALLPEPPDEWDRGDAPSPDEYGIQADQLAVKLGADKDEVRGTLRDLKDTNPTVTSQMNPDSGEWWWRDK